MIIHGASVDSSVHKPNHLPNPGVRYIIPGWGKEVKQQISVYDGGITILSNQVSKEAGEDLRKTKPIESNESPRSS